MLLQLLPLCDINLSVLMQRAIARRQGTLGQLDYATYNGAELCADPTANKGDGDFCVEKQEGSGKPAWATFHGRDDMGAAWLVSKTSDHCKAVGLSERRRASLGALHLVGGLEELLA